MLSWLDSSPLIAQIERAGEGGAHGRHCGDRARLIEPHIATQFERFPVRQSGGVHFAAHAVEYDLGTTIVPIRAGLSEIGNAGVNQVWINAG